MLRENGSEIGSMIIFINNQIEFHQKNDSLRINFFKWSE